MPSLTITAYGHTVDAVGKYRLEIGWMNEPVVSKETNAIEFYVSPLIPCPDISEGIKCAASQEFQNGISGLEKTIKIQLIYKDQNIMLPLSPDHDIPGKYFAFINPTISGYYQANILGTINEISVSLSMHPPKVDERSYIEFPESSDLTLTQIIDGHTALIADIHNLKESITNLEETQSNNVGYVGIGVGIVGIAIAIIALKTKKN